VETVYATGAIPSQEEAVRLYDSVGWSAYTRDPELLVDALVASLSVVTARVDDELVGLARVVGDGLTIVYLQDILVAPSHQRLGIGRELLRQVFEPYSEVRQRVLLTDHEPGQRLFYEAMGFREVHDLAPRLNAFVHLDRSTE
jgi:GNAT superfamily N-acetyltransferase